MDTLGNASGTLQHHLGYAIANRSFDPPHSAEGIVQNWAACAMVGRAVARFHNLSTNPQDVIMLTRPDVIFAHPIKFPVLLAAARRLNSHFTFLMRHGPEVGIIGNDPSEVALFLDRGAYDALCPENAPCLNAQNVAQMQRQGCGHVFVTLLIHAATTRNISVFYTPWAKLRLRLHGLHGMRRGFNGLGPHMAEANAYLADTTDVAETLQCVTGFDSATQTSACNSRAPLFTETLWGRARKVRMLNHGAQYYLCEQVSPLEQVIEKSWKKFV
ncbi:hypothetical protein CYMTET_41525 [Cymbomonas tetramitiformis]|uniref:Uncharacterized protein n=1 Tax=Cymbomonas tetramitiformis TaxID=36881 RepID=A0AAE0BWT2_9CHLO|nr:hypothetical protein CYMTET_46797 [Cymbomonas tetramitiformis]KAK3249046.1 hypothetical protein CYMTET_41525 [Cymbomonas tetramitiformis]